MPHIIYYTCISGISTLFAFPIYKHDSICTGIQVTSSVNQMANFLAMISRKAHLSGKICEHWGSLVRLSAFRILGSAIVADK